MPHQIILIDNAKFPMGNILVTPGAMNKLTKFEINNILQRHCVMDWGDLCDEDKALNDEAVMEGDTLHSSYFVRDTKIWVITERDRKTTQVLLPGEY